MIWTASGSFHRFGRCRAAYSRYVSLSHRTASTVAPGRRPNPRAARDAGETPTAQSLGQRCQLEVLYREHQVAEIVRRIQGLGIRRKMHGVCAWRQHERSVNLLPRSEEHTSELQSQSNLVCRLLLEKKINNPISVT